MNDIEIIYNFLDESFNDSNSSKMREDVTNYLSNRELIKNIDYF